MENRTFQVFKLCSILLNICGLNFYKLKPLNNEKAISCKSSKLNFLYNILLTLTLTVFVFKEIMFVDYSHRSESKALNMSYPIHTRVLSMEIIALIILQNISSSKFYQLLSRLEKISKKIKKINSRQCHERKWKGLQMFAIFSAYIAISTIMMILIEINLRISFSVFFRIINYLAFYFATIFTIQYATTLSYIQEEYKYINNILKSILKDNEKEIELDFHKFRARQIAWGKFGNIVRKEKIIEEVNECLVLFMDLKQVVRIVNGIFGKQILLSQVIALLGFVVNTYHLISLNLDKSATYWLNFVFLVGEIECIVVIFFNFRAAESAKNEVIFSGF